MKIYSANGSLSGQQTLQPNINKRNFPNPPAGIYFLEFSGESLKKPQTEKLIVE